MKTAIVDSTELSTRTFRRCYHIEKLVLGNNVEKIGKNALVWASRSYQMTIENPDVIINESALELGSDYEITIIAPTGLTAEQYANKIGITFKPLIAN